MMQLQTPKLFTAALLIGYLFAQPLLAQISSYSVFHSFDDGGDKICYVNENEYVRISPGAYVDETARSISSYRNILINTHLAEPAGLQNDYLKVNFGNYFSPEGDVKVTFNPEREWYEGSHSSMLKGFVAIPVSQNEGEAYEGKRIYGELSDAYTIEFGTYEELLGEIRFSPSEVLSLRPSFNVLLIRKDTKPFKRPTGSKLKCHILAKEDPQSFWGIKKELSPTPYSVRKTAISSTGKEPEQGPLVELYKWKTRATANIQKYSDYVLVVPY